MKERTLHRDDKLKSGSEPSTLVLYNDDVNTFDHVIKSLVEVCGHDSVQAEQCALIVHFKGSCEVKIGSLKYSMQCAGRLMPKDSIRCQKFLRVYYDYEYNFRDAQL